MDPLSNRLFELSYGNEDKDRTGHGKNPTSIFKIVSAGKKDSE